MTLDQLKIFATIVDAGSMRAAAEQLYRTQPTLSVAIKNLEAELGLQLFVREKARMQLTRKGQALYQRAKRVLAEAERFGEFGQQLAQGIEAEIGLVFDASIPLPFISGALKDCEKEYPHTNVNLFAENLTGVMEKLETGQADVAMVTYFEKNPIYEAMLYYPYRFFPVAASSFPAFQFEPPIPYDSMQNYIQVILTDSAQNAPNKNYRVLEKARHWRVNNPQVRKELIVAGLAWGTLPEFVMARELDQGLLRPLQIENHYRFRESELCIIRHADKVHGPAAQCLWESFAASAENIPTEYRSSLEFPEQT